MKNASKILVTLAVVALGITSCKQDRVEPQPTQSDIKNPVIETPQEAKLGDVISMATATPFNLSDIPQINSDKEDALEKQNNPAKVKSLVQSYEKRFRVYSYLYCESKGGDDGSRLEPYGFVQVLPVNSAGGIIAAPQPPGSSLVMNQAKDDFFYVSPGQTRFLKSVDYILDTRYNTRLMFKGHLVDDDMNGDDGYFPNSDDDMGRLTTFVTLADIINDSDDHIYRWQRYVNGNQIIWVKHSIYVL